MTKRPLPAAPDRLRWRFTRAFRRTNPLGTPRGIAWFGFRSFWGHLQHLIASAIATEDVDTRDWMEPTPPEEFGAKITATLGVENKDTLVESLGRDLYIDFVSDTGDDGEVSQEVGNLIFQSYLLPDPRNPDQDLEIPRGDILIHAGDLAYPVATPAQIHDRLIVPWNRALRDVGDDEKGRVLLGVPGNHDWYGGVDGFARLFRERYLAEKSEPPTEPLDLHFIPEAFQFVGNLVMGETRKQVPPLVLQGYKTVQRASYFILKLTPKLHLYGADRQLRRIDYRQKRFFRDHFLAHPEASRMIVTHYPVMPFGRPSRAGLGILRDLQLSPEREPHLYLCGDVHHYRREKIGKAVHVTAGGGGAFLHTAPLRGERTQPEVQWPGPLQCSTLLHKVPLHIASGRSGLIAHAVMGLFFAPALALAVENDTRIVPASITAGLLIGIGMALIGGVRRGPWLPIASLALLAGTLLALVPTLTVWGLEYAFHMFGLQQSTMLWSFIAMTTTLLAGGFIFGSFLTALTFLGLDNLQALTALSHPGFRHFMRLRVRADGSGVDAWCIGLEDPLNPDEKPVLVDSFEWKIQPEDEPARQSLRPVSSTPPRSDQ